MRSVEQQRNSGDTAGELRWMLSSSHSIRTMHAAAAPIQMCNINRMPRPPPLFPSFRSLHLARHGTGAKELPGSVSNRAAAPRSFDHAEALAIAHDALAPSTLPSSILIFFVICSG